MDDKTIMENILHTQKSACDLYLHGAIESSTANVHEAFSGALSDSLSIQNSVYKKMSSKGWYSTNSAPEQQIKQVKQKFSSQ